MHRLLRKELDAAGGNSEFVVAINLDIRGFSDWSLKVDSAQTALYLKKLYAKLIDSYFSDASFLKPTGDGLLIVETVEEESLAETLTRVVENSKEIVEGFGEICASEPMINFEVPQDVGIGIARGSASRLATADRTLDYSGNVLNLASRLMDLARPRGVVLDEGFGMNLLPNNVAEEFSRHGVYLKGVSPNRAAGVYCWPSELEIPPMHLKPLEEERWLHKRMTTTLKELETSDSRRYRFELDASPLPESQMECQVSHAAVTPGRRKAKSRITTRPFPVMPGEVAGQPVARIDQKDLAKTLRAVGVGPSWEIRVTVSYRIS